MRSGPGGAAGHSPGHGGCRGEGHGGPRPPQPGFNLSFCFWLFEFYRSQVRTACSWWFHFLCRSELLQSSHCPTVPGSSLWVGVRLLRLLRELGWQGLGLGCPKTLLEAALLPHSGHPLLPPSLDGFPEMATSGGLSPMSLPISTWGPLDEPLPDAHPRECRGANTYICTHAHAHAHCISSSGQPQLRFPTGQHLRRGGDWPV